MIIQKAIDKFIADRKVYCAPNTIDSYVNMLRIYSDYCRGNKIVNIKQINQEHLKAYCVYLKDIKKIKNVSIHSYFRAVYALISFLIDSGDLQNFRYKIKLPRSDAEIVLPLTESEVKILETYLHSDRDLLIFRLMLDCGLRSSEVRHLKFKDINLDQNVIFINNSKFNTNRMIPLPGRVRSQFKILYPEVENQNDYLLDLTENCIKQIFKRLKLRSNINRIHAHLLRHTFASSYMSNHSNIEYLRLYMGHSSYLVTQKYVHIASTCNLNHYDIYKIDDCFI